MSNKPVIGILSQTIDFDIPAKLADKFKGVTSYISASYVKYLQASGARIIPIISLEDEISVTQKVMKLNGIFFPGGEGDYDDNGKLVMQ